MNLKNESQIRPKDIYNEYLRLVEKDLSLYDFHNHKIYKCKKLLKILIPVF